MKKIVLIIPFFGEFPNYFELFLNSCKENPTIDWLIFTDTSMDCSFPKNVQFINISFEDLKNKIQNKFDFTISLETPYKLCDYKPAYGYIFEEYLSKYDFWGHCDCDLLFGDLRKFLPDEKINTYDKIGHLGHLTLYRNCNEINRKFMQEIDGEYRYREVFSVANICVFDEWDDLSVNKIFLKDNKRLWLWNEFFDANPHDDNFVRVTHTIDKKNLENHYIENSKPYPCVSWENGKVFCWYRNKFEWKKEEVAYVHFQKRNMRMNCTFFDKKIICIPDEMVSMSDLMPKDIVWKTKLRVVFNKKKTKHKFNQIKYWIIEKTGPIRHRFR